MALLMHSQPWHRRPAFSSGPCCASWQVHVPQEPGIHPLKGFIPLGLVLLMLFLCHLGVAWFLVLATSALKSRLQCLKLKDKAGSLQEGFPLKANFVLCTCQLVRLLLLLDCGFASIINHFQRPKDANFSIVGIVLRHFSANKDQPIPAPTKPVSLNSVSLLYVLLLFLLFSQCLPSTWKIPSCMALMAFPPVPAAERAGSAVRRAWPCSDHTEPT